MKNYYLLVAVFLNFGCVCSSIIKEKNTDCEKASIVRKELNLSKNKFNSIKADDSIVNGIYVSIKDTVQTKLINRRLDSFLLKNYTRKEFFVSLKVDRAFKKAKTPMEIKRKNIVTDLKNFDNAEEAAKQYFQAKKSLIENIKWSSKDSINKP